MLTALATLGPRLLWRGARAAGLTAPVDRRLAAARAAFAVDDVLLAAMLVMLSEGIDAVSADSTRSEG